MPQYQYIYCPGNEFVGQVITHPLTFDEPIHPFNRLAIQPKSDPTEQSKLLDDKIRIRANLFYGITDVHYILADG